MIQTPTPLPPGLDPNYVFNELMPLIAIVTILVTVGVTLRWLFRTPVGEALAERIRRGIRSHPEGGDEARQMLQERVTRLEDQLSELTDRLDFAERMLTVQREPRLGPGGRQE